MLDISWISLGGSKRIHPMFSIVSGLNAGLEQKFLNDQFSIFLFVNYCKIKITSSILEKLPPVNIHVDNLFFHFFQAYGGLRGAVAFSLVDLLEHGDFQKNTKDMFMTTCLALIFFTVFVQVS